MCRQLTILTFSVFFLGCDKEIDINPQEFQPSITELKAKAVDTLNINANRLTLDAYLYRDFMPVSPPNGKPMIAINWLIDVDSMKIPEHLEMVGQAVIYGDSIWISDYEPDDGITSSEFKWQRTSRDGPKWGPDVYVDVISLVRDTETEKEYCIQKERVFVSSTF